MSWVTARSCYPKAEPQKQENFKKNIAHVKSVIPRDIDNSKLDIWFSDETRIGQQGSLTRIWYYKGNRPRIVRQQQFISGYFYGAVYSQTGESVGLFLPYANIECMKLFLEELNNTITRERHAVVLIG